MNAAIARLAAARLVKACHACGVTFTAAQWGDLPYLGVQSDPLFATELRNCGCGTTLGRTLGLSEDGRRLDSLALQSEQDALLEHKVTLERSRQWTQAEDLEDELLVINNRLQELDENGTLRATR